MSGILVDLEVLKGRMPAKPGPEADQFLPGVIEAASDWITARAGREFLEAAFTETFSEERLLGRYGEQLAIGNAPVKASPAPTVTEDGKALTVTGSYDAAGSFEVVYDPDKGIFYRTRRLSDPFQAGNAGWSRGLRNIVIAYTGAGFAGGVPKRIESACVELSYLIWQQGKAGGMDSMNLPNMTARAARQLSDVSKQAIDSFIEWGRR